MMFLRNSRKVAVVGFARGTRHQAPFFDPNVEIWGLNELYLHLPRFSRWFQMHDRKTFEGGFRDEEHFKWLRNCKKPIYMPELHPDIPCSVRYPIEEIEAELGGYFTCSVAYMVALAIYERFDEIGLFGTDFIFKVDSGKQKECIEYFLGLAKGKGIRVHLGEDTRLLRGGRFQAAQDNLPVRRPHKRWSTLQTRRAKVLNDMRYLEKMMRRLSRKRTSPTLDKELKALRVQHEKCRREVEFIVGSIQECTDWFAEVKKRS